MTPERAQQIIDQCPRDPFGAKSNPSKNMTYDEVQQVKDVWDTLPGSTCFNDALRYIATGVFVR